MLWWTSAQCRACKLQGNAELQQRLEAMAQLQQETIRAYAGDSVYDGESHADSNGGPRNTPSGASSRNTAQEKSRRSSLLKRVAQLEAANQVLQAAILHVILSSLTQETYMKVQHTCAFWAQQLPSAPTGPSPRTIHKLISTL